MRVELDGQEREATAAVVLQETHELRDNQLVLGAYVGRRWVRLVLDDGTEAVGLLEEPNTTDDLQMRGRTLRPWDPQPPAELLAEPLERGYLVSRTKKMPASA